MPSHGISATISGTYRLPSRLLGSMRSSMGQQDDGGGQPEHRGQKVCCCGTAGHAMLRAVEGAAGACFVELRAQILDFAFACAFGHSASLLPPFSRLASQVCRWLPFITFPFTIRNTARVRHLLPARFTVLLRAPVPHATMRTFLSHFLLRGMAALEQTTLMTCLRNGENTGMGE